MCLFITKQINSGVIVIPKTVFSILIMRHANPIIRPGLHLYCTFKEQFLVIPSIYGQVCCLVVYLSHFQPLQENP